MGFCKEYNARTAHLAGNIIPAEITIYQDSSFTFELGTPPTPDLLRKAAGVPKGSAEPNRDKVGTITKQQLREIAETKMRDLNAIDIEGAELQIMGTARSMGIRIRDLSSARSVSAFRQWEGQPVRTTRSAQWAK